MFQGITHEQLERVLAQVTPISLQGLALVKQVMPTAEDTPLSLVLNPDILASAVRELRDYQLRSTALLNRLFALDAQAATYEPINEDFVL